VNGSLVVHDDPRLDAVLSYAHERDTLCRLALRPAANNACGL
jgi:hypothetical protein